ncbi:MAG: YggS family pyridoxal phosphate-dependent enzyme [Thermomonas sp.]
MNRFRQAHADILLALDNASRAAIRPDSVRLLAVSKTRTVTEVSELAATGQRAFGENYVQEAVPKIDALQALALEWHLIGHLQSNKAQDAARAFDWVQTIDRAKLVPLLARHRPATLPLLNVLVQVNIDDEASKHGCTPAEAMVLADLVAAEPRLRLRGLMAIPAPHENPQRRLQAFRAMRELFDAIARPHPGIDTLSMGMSDDFVPAIEQGATMVRVGSALFGPHVAPKQESNS